MKPSCAHLYPIHHKAKNATHPNPFWVPNPSTFLFNNTAKLMSKVKLNYCIYFNLEKKHLTFLKKLMDYTWIWNIIIIIITPPQKSVPEGRRPNRATALRSNASPLGRSPSGTDFWGGVWKEMTKKSTQWKWKQWKPEKVTDWCKNGAKSTTIWNQTLIVRNSG